MRPHKFDAMLISYVKVLYYDNLNIRKVTTVVGMGPAA